MKSRIALLALLALSGCASQKPNPPQTAAVTPPVAWRDELGGESQISARWWRGFGDPALSQTVERALANNLDIQIAAERVNEARAQYRIARAARLPSLTFAAEGGPQRAVDAFGQGLDQTAGGPELAVSYDVDLFGRIANSSAAARASFLASNAARDSVRLAVAASAADGYITLRALDARLDVLHETLAARAESLRIDQRRADAGYATALELDQARAEYHATEQLIPATELAVRREEDGLSVLLGDAPGEIERGARLSMMTPPPIPGAGLPSALLRRRPDLAKAEDQLVAADHSLDSARAAMLPSVQLTGAVGEVFSDAIVRPIDVYSLGAGLVEPLFDGGRLRARAAVAASRRNQAAFAYRKAALVAFREVEDALAATRRTQEQEQSLEAQRDALVAALRQAASRYRAGYSPYLEQLDAQRGLLATELAVIQARADRLTVAVGLYQALGGGWRP